MSHPVSSSLRQVLVTENFATQHDPWVALDGGRTNWVWKVGEDEQAVICKLYAAEDNNPVYPNLPGTEYDTLKALHAYGIAPEPLALLNSTDGDLLIYRCLNGETWQRDATPVADLLGRLHSIGLRFPLRRLASGSAALLQQSRMILRGLETAFDPPTWMATAMPVPPTVDLAILHTDVVPGNIISSAGTLRLIDWQCPALGDPCEDIASFLSPAMQLLYRGQPLSADEQDAFLASYPNQRIVDRYQSLAPYYHLRIAAYCAWKLAKGEHDYAAAFKAEVAALEASQQS